MNNSQEIDYAYLKNEERDILYEMNPFFSIGNGKSGVLKNRSD